MNDPISALLASAPGRDVIVVSHEITRALHPHLSTALKKKQSDKCTLFLTTYGGDPDGAYRIARCLQHNYTHIRVVVPSFCKSAGTLIAICANELALGDLGELGPLDAQMRKTHELLESGSGLDGIQAMQICGQQVQGLFRQVLLELRREAKLSTKVAGDFAARLANAVCEPLYAQVDVNRLGEMQRAMDIALQYGRRLNAKSGALKPDALENLVVTYPSHGFVIDRKEARELFQNVSAPTDSERAFFEAHWEILGMQNTYLPQLIPNGTLTPTPTPITPIPGADHENTGHEPTGGLEDAGAGANEQGRPAEAS